MKLKQFKEYIELGLIHNVCIYLKTGVITVHAYGRIPSGVNESIETARGEKREYSSIDTAYRFIRNSGYKQTIILD